MAIIRQNVLQERSCASKVALLSTVKVQNDYNRESYSSANSKFLTTCPEAFCKKVFLITSFWHYGKVCWLKSSYICCMKYKSYFSNRKEICFNFPRLSRFLSAWKGLSADRCLQYCYYIKTKPKRTSYSFSSLVATSKRQNRPYRWGFQCCWK